MIDKPKTDTSLDYDTYIRGFNERHATYARWLEQYPGMAGHTVSAIQDNVFYLKLFIARNKKRSQ